MNTHTEDEAQVRIFLRNHHLAVIATNTCSKQSPESALIAFVEDDNLSLYFQTSSHSRKFKNIALNQTTSLVVGLELDEMATLQYEGVAQQLKAKADIESCKALFLAKKSPTNSEYLERVDTVLFKVTPTWIRYSYYPKGSTHGHMIELKFQL